MARSTRVDGSFLRVDRMEDGNRRLVRPLILDMGDDVGIPPGQFPGFDVVDGHTRVTVPPCFVTDFSSIPGPARPFYRFSSVDLAGVCHDWAYRVGVDKKRADRCWKIVAMAGRTSLGPLRGGLGYWALRVGGLPAYLSNRRKRQDGDMPRDPVGAPCECMPCGEAG